MKKIGREDLVEELQAQLEELGLFLSKEKIRLVIKAYSNTVKAATVDGVDDYEGFNLGFGTFYFSEVAAREGVSHITGSAWSTPAHKRLRFRPSESLAEDLKHKTSK